ncbi:G-protein coupled receptor 161-like [Paramacrobiotus metropolitanus]|uniref:G-protein coupled receptor 161-like n=1 Tax=Paramacrobiotus metropolitanus TaxID=2943436 RepID=UPI002446534F|nr:G-protein coupled receptor 161-like [Paramacrobiotus metropolitanus]
MESFHNRSFLANATMPVTHTLTEVKWTPSLIGQAVVFGLSFVSNVVVFVEFVRVPSRLTPFTMYLLVLLATNIAFLISVPLIEMLNELYGHWWMGRVWCNIHNYFNGVVSAAQICVHVTISINRLWAVHYPISYKNHHNKKVALITSFAAIAFANVVGLPGCIRDALYFSIDLKYGCHINYSAQMLWGQIQQTLLHILPLVFIIIAYIHLCVNRIRRKRKLQDHSSSGSRNAAATAADAGATSAEKNKTGKTTKEAVKPFLVLSLTAISVTICWTPAVIYFGAIIFSGSWMSGTFFIVSVTFYSLQALVDPWLFAFGLLAVKKNWNSIRCPGC